MRAEMAAVSVAGQNDQLGAAGGGDHLGLDAAGTFDRRASASEAGGGVLQEFVRGGGGEILHLDAGVAMRLAASRSPA